MQHGERSREGLIGSIIHLLGLTLAVPDHSTRSRRAETLDVPRRVVSASHLTVIPYDSLASAFLTGKYRSKEDLGGSDRARP